MPIFNPGSGGIVSTDPTVTITVSQFWVNILGAATEEEARDRLGFPDYQPLAEKDQPNGYAALNAQRKLDAARIPDLGIGALQNGIEILQTQIEELEAGAGAIEAGAGAIAAYISFNGSTNPPQIINKTLNCASIDDFGSGFYRVNFSPQLPEKFIAFATGKYIPGSPMTHIALGQESRTSINLQSATWASPWWVDSLQVNLIVFEI